MKKQHLYLFMLFSICAITTAATAISAAQRVPEPDSGQVAGPNYLPNPYGQWVGEQLPLSLDPKFSVLEINDLADRSSEAAEQLPERFPGYSLAEIDFIGDSSDQRSFSTFERSTPTDPTAADWWVLGNQYSHTGRSVASAGDVNGDGYDDVIVGSPYYRVSTNSYGGAFVWYGSAEGLGETSSLSDADWMVIGDEQGSEFGYSVASAGDVNGDGFDDVIVGTQFYDGGEINSGAVFVWHGSPTGLAGDAGVGNYDWVAYGDQVSAFLGNSVGSAGDVNGDGYDDVIIGCIRYNSATVSGSGAAFVWYGSETGLGVDGAPSNADWYAVGDHEWAYIGDSVGTAGDVNGDGYDDVIVGAYNYDSEDYNQAGAVWVWYGSDTGLGLGGSVAEADWTAIGDQSWPPRFGEAVGTAGDVNGDGFDEVIVGAPTYTYNLGQTDGAVFVWYGSANGLGDDTFPGDADWNSVVDADTSWLGLSVGTAGDVNSDGYDDIIAGAPFFQPDPNGTPDPGAFYVWFGSADGIQPQPNGWFVEAEDSINLGYSVATAGDVNGDEAADVIVGAPRFPNDVTDGAALVFHGQSQPHFFLKVAGPKTAAPGQTVDYAIAYHNLLTQTVESAVLVLDLPMGSEYIDSTGGGVYWQVRHQVFWKLGDLDPGMAGHLSARVRIEWGLQNGTGIDADTKLAGTNWGQGGFDVTPYLTYQPQELFDSIPLSEEDIDSERIHYPDLDAIYSRAINDGFEFGGASRIDLSHQEAITQVILLHEERSEVMQIERKEEDIQAMIFGPGRYAAQDAYGGMELDYKNDTVSVWGTWSNSSQEVFKASECELSMENCFSNCMTEKAKWWLVKYYSKAASIISGGIDCAKGFEGDPLGRAKCIAQLSKKLPGASQGLDVYDCYRDCEDDFESHICSEDKQFCDNRWWSIYNLFGIDSVVKAQCVDCKYQLPPVTVQVCALSERCEDCPGVPKCLANDQCCGESCGNQSSLPCPRTQESCTTCSTSECEVQPAQDPNEKFGIDGDVLPGQLLTYTITYANEGEGQAYGVFIVDELDVNLDDSTLAVGSGEYISSTRKLFWDVGELAPSGELGSSGAVSFTIAVSPGVPAGTVISNEAVVHFPSAAETTPTGTVVNVVQLVVAFPQYVETTYAKPVTVTLVGQAVYTEPITFAITVSPSFGTISGTLPNLIYTPMGNFTGPDFFSFVAHSSSAISRQADVSIMVLPSVDDVTAPMVMWTSPSAGEIITMPFETYIVTDTVGPAYPPSLLVRFSEPLDTATVTTNNILLEHSEGGSTNITLNYSEWSNWLTIVPREPWQVGDYTVTLFTGLTDTSGNPLSEDVSWTFSVNIEGEFVFLPFVIRR